MSLTMPLSELTADTFLNGRIRLFQPRKGYRASIDPVLLAAATPVMPQDRVLELGCGSGTAALCLLARKPEICVTGLEIRPAMVKLACRNAAVNGLSQRFTVIEGNLRCPPEVLLPNSFHHVIANPPYQKVTSGKWPFNEDKAIAHMEIYGGLKDWIKTALRFVCSKGSITLIYHVDRLDELLTYMRPYLGELILFPLWPKQGMNAKRVILRGRRDLRTPFRISPGLILHEADGTFTKTAQQIIRHAKALEL